MAETIHRPADVAAGRAATVGAARSAVASRSFSSRRKIIFGDVAACIIPA